jgi:hypothetical protein
MTLFNVSRTREAFIVANLYPAPGFAPKFHPAPELQTLHTNHERLQESTS